MRRVRSLFLAATLLVALAIPARAGSIFLTGHDPDFHAILGGNAAGAIRLNQVAIGFVQDPKYRGIVEINGVACYQVTGNTSPYSYREEYGALYGDFTVNLIFEFHTDVPAAERRELIDATLATVQWK